MTDFVEYFEEEYQYEYADSAMEVLAEDIIHQELFDENDLDFRKIDQISAITVKNCADALNLNEDRTEWLLQSSRWNEEKLFDAVFSNDTVKLYNEEPSVVPFECAICWEYPAEDQRVDLNCRHSYCLSCLGTFLNLQVAKGPSCVLTICPAYKCKQGITRHNFRTILGPDAYFLYNRYAAMRFIECSGKYKCCPSTTCDKVVVSTKQAFLCNSCTPICFICCGEEHRPTSCAYLNDWNSRCEQDDDSDKWILANTKKCPKCFVSIEKNNGCNHMTCRQCKHEFCWICRGNWLNHKTCHSAGASNSPQITNDLQEYRRFYEFYGQYEGYNKLLSQCEQLLRKSSKTDDQIRTRALLKAISCFRLMKYTTIEAYFTLNSGKVLLLQSALGVLNKSSFQLYDLVRRNTNYSEMADLTRAVDVHMELITSTVKSA